MSSFEMRMLGSHDEILAVLYQSRWGDDMRRMEEGTGYTDGLARVLISERIPNSSAWRLVETYRVSPGAFGEASVSCCLSPLSDSPHGRTWVINEQGRMIHENREACRQAGFVA
jgi:hypothetical protein